MPKILLWFIGWGKLGKVESLDLKFLGHRARTLRWWWIRSVNAPLWTRGCWSCFTCWTKSRFLSPQFFIHLIEDPLIRLLVWNFLRFLLGWILNGHLDHARLALMLSRPLLFEGACSVISFSYCGKLGKHLLSFFLPFGLNHHLPFLLDACLLFFCQISLDDFDSVA